MDPSTSSDDELLPPGPGEPGYDLDAEVAVVVRRRPRKVSFATATQSDDADSHNVSAAPPTPRVELGEC